jgi:hypothetical protein
MDYHQQIQMYVTQMEHVQIQTVVYVTPISQDLNVTYQFVTELEVTSHQHVIIMEHV